MSNQESNLVNFQQNDQDNMMPSITSGQELQHLLFNPRAMDQLMQLATIMSRSLATVPKHLRNNVGDCMAICMQSAQWGMNPFSVSQKTFLSPGGQLSYEAQLVNAVVVTKAPIKGRFDFEFIGDWNKILGRVKEMESKKEGGGKYYVPDWNTADEKGLGVIIRGTFIGDEAPKTVTIMLSQCWPRFSTQWATDPQQQITYVAVKKWARRYCPDVILGVYTPDELEDYTPGERDMGSARVEPSPQQQEKPELKGLNDEEFDRRLGRIAGAIESGQQAPKAVIDSLSTRYALTEAQIKKIEDLAPKQEETPA